MFDKHLKITSLAIVLLCSIQFSWAQSNYFKWSAGIGGGINHTKTDVYKGGWDYTVYGTIDYHFTPFVTGGIEAQYGELKGGSIVTDPHNRQFVNKYSSVAISGKAMLGEFVDYEQSKTLNALKGLYAGIGIGVVNNNMTYIVRYKPSWAAFDPGYGPFPGKDKSLNLWVPLNLGINFFINDGYGYVRYAINVNAQSSFTFGEGLDGYNDPVTQFKNFDPDTYTVYSVGVKYFFGNVKAYRKSL
ncbi:hypothetical protein [Pedobacter punctiformis]|uniref:Outer membrane protein beta-barrel domain-containing protein n=1 Tax=Pedobacter punctiformis TaxID=3004097 RepID=A0ABT4L801_9SPHI|nr:hypothetical protein [Pedobacter sp. HCMS5-2]MCZ4243288.1 hypothetical protein [Pedobacter sp. HCMS5-2]